VDTCRHLDGLTGSPLLAGTGPCAPRLLHTGYLAAANERLAVDQRGTRPDDSRQRPYRSGLESAEPAGGDHESHDGPRFDLAGAVCDGRAVEGQVTARSILDDAQTSSFIEFGHVADQWAPPHRQEVVQSSPDGRHGPARSVHDLRKCQFDDVHGPAILECGDQHIDLRFGYHRLHREATPTEQLRDGG
jgi:hypothetical protein